MNNQTENKKSVTQHDRIQDRLDRYRQGLPSEGTSRAKKTARTMLIVNVILIAVMFLVYKSTREPEYYSSTLEYGTLLYRLSISHDTRSRSYITSLTVKSTATAEKNFVFIAGTIGTLSITADGVSLYRTPLGEKIRELRLGPGEARSYLKPLPDEPILAYAKSHPDLLFPKRRVFLFSDKQHIPLQARFSPGDDEKIAATIDFRFEVK